MKTIRVIFRTDWALLMAYSDSCFAGFPHNWNTITDVLDDEVIIWRTKEDSSIREQINIWELYMSEIIILFEKETSRLRNNNNKITSFEKNMIG